MEQQQCPVCEGQGKYIGTLGVFDWHKCRQCGYQFYTMLSERKSGR